MQLLDLKKETVKEQLTEEQVNKLVYLFSDLRKEYEDFRKNAHVMESSLQYNARMIARDLARRGYTI